MSKRHRIDIGPNDPWPDMITIDGKPYTLYYMTTAPTMGVYEKMKDHFPNLEDFNTWNQDFKESLNRTQYYAVQYEGPDGDRVMVERFPDTVKGKHSTTCNDCGAILYSDDPTPEEKAQGMTTIYRCKCGLVYEEAGK